MNKRKYIVDRDRINVYNLFAFSKKIDVIGVLIYGR